MFSLILSVSLIGMCACLIVRRISLQDFKRRAVGHGQAFMPSPTPDYEAIALEVEWRGDRVR